MRIGKKDAATVYGSFNYRIHHNHLGLIAINSSAKITTVPLNGAVNNLGGGGLAIYPSTLVGCVITHYDAVPNDVIAILAKNPSPFTDIRTGGVIIFNQTITNNAI